MTPPLRSVPKNETETPAGATNQLEQIAADAEKSVPKQFLNGFHRLMAAGKKAMADPVTYDATAKYLDSINSSDKIPEMIAHAVLKLLTLIWNESKGTMPIEPVGAASIVFMCDGLEYLRDEKKMTIDNAVIDQTTFAVKDGTLAFIKDASMKKGLSEEDVMKGMTGKGGPPPPAPTASPEPVAPVEEEVA